MPVFEIPEDQYLPDGTYNFIVTSCEYRLPEGNRRFPDYVVTLRVNDGEFFGKEIVDYFALSDKSIWKIARFLKAIGYEVGKSFDTDAFDPIEIQGRECVAVVQAQEAPGGRSYARINRYLMASESSMF